LRSRAAHGIGCSSLPGGRVTGAEVDAVLGVAGVAADHELGGEQLAASALDLEVDVGSGAPGVGHGLDGAEVVLAGRAGDEPPEPLEVLVACGVSVVAIEVDPVSIHLPNLD